MLTFDIVSIAEISIYSNVLKKTLAVSREIPSEWGSGDLNIRWVLYL